MKEGTHIRGMGVESDESLDLELLVEHSILVGLLMEVPSDELNDDLGKTRGEATRQPVSRRQSPSS